MPSSGRTARPIIPKGQLPDSAQIKLCAEHEPTMFKDQDHVRQWMATATNDSSVHPGQASALPYLDHPVFDENYPGYYDLGQQGPTVDLTSESYDSFIYNSTHYPGNMGTANFHSDSVSSEDGSTSEFKYDVPSSADMAYTRSNQSAIFPSDFSTSSGFAYPIGGSTQAQFSTSTAWSSPSTTAMEPQFVSETTSGFVPCLITSPMVHPTPGDFRPSFPGYDDGLPASMFGSPHTLSHGNSTIRPVRSQIRTSISEGTFWPPAEESLEMNLPMTESVHENSCSGLQNSIHGSPRDHHLYHVEANLTDHLYYCPFGASEGCRHKPDKLKCNYDKHLDSHLKPYRCKFGACASSKFSSTACLLRHEREAHGMHGHGSNPFKCPYQGCDRGRGFPRRYNLEDHMKRMHGFQPTQTGRRKSQADADASRASSIRNGKRRSATTSAGSSTTQDQTASRVHKYATTRGSASSRRKSFQ